MGQWLGLGRPSKVLWEGEMKGGEVTAGGVLQQFSRPQRRWTWSQDGGATALRTLIVCGCICIPPQISLLFPPSPQDPPAMELRGPLGANKVLQRRRLVAALRTPMHPIATSPHLPDE
ncbi:hypothetical protein FKM82_024505 [Ascaphus truei]